MFWVDIKRGKKQTCMNQNLCARRERWSGCSDVWRGLSAGVRGPLTSAHEMAPAAAAVLAALLVGDNGLI